MGHFTILHGYIYGNGEPDDNAKAIAALPETDTWPYLTRDMFAIPTRDHAYWDHVIAFGSLYNGVERAWDEWLAKFEALLRTLDWDEAHVYLETEVWGDYHFVWQSLSYDDLELPNDVAPPPPPWWKFNGGPRTNLREAYERREVEQAGAEQ